MDLECELGWNWYTDYVTYFNVTFALKIDKDYNNSFLCYYSIYFTDLEEVEVEEETKTPATDSKNMMHLIADGEDKKFIHTLN